MSLLPAALVIATLTAGVAARPARATTNPVSEACGLSGLVRAAAARPCPARRPVDARSHPDLLGIHLGTIVGTVTGTVLKSVVLAPIVNWVVDDAGRALRFTASLIGSTTRPNLQSTWFSASYWRVAAVSALLTLPFLFAAGIHALVRSDLALLGRAAFGYLPLALIGVAVAAPLTMVVLSATDEMSSVVSAASGHSDAVFLAHASLVVGATSLVDANPFIAFFVGLVTVAATMTLWVELIVRGAAVYVIVLMLPLFFAAMVWPARRVWAIRSVETLFALILSKFAIVAVLALGGAALGHSATSGPAALLTGATLIILATFSPWALLRLLPLHEVASAAAGSLSQAPRGAVSQAIQRAERWADGAAALAGGGAVADGDDGDGTGAALKRLPREAGGGAAGRSSSGSPDHTTAGRPAADADAAPADGAASVVDAGLAAVAGAGAGAGNAAADVGSGSPGSLGPSGPDGPGSGPHDTRAPINLPFRGGRWQGIFLEDAEPPVIAPDPGAAGPTSGGADGNRAPSAASDARTTEPPPLDVPPPPPDVQPPPPIGGRSDDDEVER